MVLYFFFKKIRIGKGPFDFEPVLSAVKRSDPFPYGIKVRKGLLNTALNRSMVEFVCEFSTFSVAFKKPFYQVSVFIFTKALKSEFKLRTFLNLQYHAVL